MRIVIMAGGGGTRLWPASRAATPKQFMQLVGDESLLQMSVRRITPSVVGPERAYVTTNASYAGQVRAELPELPPSHVFIEPARRDNAAAIGLAIIRLLHENGGKDETFVMLTADHAIKDPALFRRLIRGMDAYLEREPESLVMIGIRPTYPETGYGYIKMDDTTRDEQDGLEVFRVDRFEEKPPLALAEKYVRDWTYLWNSGEYAFRLLPMWEKYQRFLPELAAGLETIRAALGTKDEGRVLAEVYPTLQATSIDYGITEHAERVVVFPAADLGWSDIGIWQSLQDIMEPDADGNIVRADHVGIDTKNAIIYRAGKGKRLIATMGVDDLIIVDTDDALLITDRAHAPAIKPLLERLKTDGHADLL